MNTLETATLGGGCFWCLDAVFRKTLGVHAVRSGFAGGDIENPTYRAVVTGTTGHAEVVQIDFDPSVISYEVLLQIFFTIHDPTTLNRQGADRGTQYRSIILTHGPEQMSTARRVMDDLESQGVFPDPIVTQVKELEDFWQAEEAHDDFYARNPYQPYCRIVIDPKVAKFRARFSEWMRPEATNPS